MSGDELLVEAFRNGEDITRGPRPSVLGVPPLMVTPRRAMSQGGELRDRLRNQLLRLAANLGISRGEADRYIKNYFARYTGVRRFIDAPSRKCG